MAGLVVSTNGLTINDQLAFEAGLGSGSLVLVLETSWLLMFNNDNLVWDTDQLRWGV